MDASDWEKFANIVEHWQGSKGALAATLKRKADRLRADKLRTEENTDAKTE